MEEANIDKTYCLKNCDKDCWRKASKYKFKGGEHYKMTTKCIENDKKQ